jgi:site-specific DNA-methyltransferase (adenine-specific)
MTQSDWKNKLFYGDNLDVLREHIADESVDLIYLDPPFNSKRDYNLLFKTPKKPAKAKKAALETEADDEPSYSDAQITAFEDTWHWNETAEREFNEIMKHGNSDVAELMQALRSFLKENDMLAYLTMMCNRLLELHRVLKPTGSLYLHCDPTASHYLKLVLDGVFGKESYQNEVVWKRTTTHSDSKTWSRVADKILFYTKQNKYVWNTPYESHGEDYVADKYRYDDDDGRGSYGLWDMTSPNPRPNMMYVWKGFPFPEKGWRYEKDTMTRLDADGRVWYPMHPDGSFDTTKRPRLKRYLSEMKGGVMGTVWTDISPINSQATERLGYPTQKPLALLERIIGASSNEGDVVLDPFCGCGTAVHAAEKLKRRWIGIDITHLSIGLIEKRMREAFPYLVKTVHGSTSSPRTGTVVARTVNAFEVIGTPQDFAAASDLAERDKHQFQSWACMLVGAQLYKGGKKGADGGIDGLLWIEVGKGKTEKVIVQVKGGTNVTRANIATLKGDVDREKAAIGLFITLEPPSQPMKTEAAAAGMYESPHHGAFPKIQILTIEGLLNSKERPLFPDLSRGEQTFKKAKREKTNDASKQRSLI